MIVCIYDCMRRFDSTAAISPELTTRNAFPFYNDKDKEGTNCNLTFAYIFHAIKNEKLSIAFRNHETLKQHK